MFCRRLTLTIGTPALFSTPTHSGRRGLATAGTIKKIVCALYPDPQTGFPPKYARDTIPTIKGYANGATAPSPKGLDFKPGELVGCVSGALGLRPFCEKHGISYVVTDDKEGPNSVFAKEMKDADIVMSQPFFPSYITAERFASAPNLKMCITAGIGSDHVDLEAAVKHKVDVVEVSGSNSVSVAEHEVMALLALVRNFIPSHDIARSGGWHISDCVARSYDLEGMEVGTVGAGRIGQAVMRMLKPFGVKLHYTDQYRLSPAVEKELGATYHPTMEHLIKNVDAVHLNCPLYPGTEGMFNAKLLASMRRGAYIINNARGKLMDRDALVAAVERGQIAGYAGDVWFPQPAPKDHPWRNMSQHGMTPHISGTSLSAQARYAAGVREILECILEGRPIREEYYIVKAGALAGAGANAYKPGNATGGSMK